MDCRYLLACTLALVSVRKETNENILSFTYEVEVDSDLTAPKERAVLSLRLGE